ncbi:uncharacterized protein LOC127276934 isoform X1 [Leptopilina boulardi]|uniref:uncharacterized protein LOC127276934 isoform X1 n=1 Tax=Leptopilina boulardi TaxID=63433 RepID=UPI0021F68BE7|nr:uncharacterized protein LOC127276934 isoform X1 [Leptopilina boulardi]
MLHDDLNFLYLVFLRPILYEVNRLNKIFQADNVDLGRAVEDLHALVLFIARKIVKPTFLNREIKDLLAVHDNELAFLNRDQVDFGIEYYQGLGRCTISIEQKIDLENRALTFLKRLFHEMGERLPENLQLFEGLKAFSPNVCLSQTRPRFKDLPLIDTFIDKNKLGLVENQWNKLVTIQWSNHLDKSLLTKAQTFWPKVYSFEDAAGTSIFRDLASYALTLLSLPSTNAVVERVFLVMNSVKSKLRNKMGVPMLDSLLRVRCRFHATKTCCSEFSPTKKMLEKFNYKVVYAVKNNNDEGPINNEIFELLDEIEHATISIPEF